MFLENSFSGKNDVGRWIAMIVIIVIATQIIGLIPLGLMMFFKLNYDPDLVPDPENPLDLSAYDISSLTGLSLLIIPFILGLITLLVLMKPIHERPALSVISGAAAFRWKRFMWGAAVWLVLVMLYAVFAAITGLQKIEFQFQPDTIIQLIILSVILIPLQAGFEEAFFRGYLMQGFCQLFLNRWAPLAFTSLLFGGLHYFNPEVKAFGLAVMIPQYIWFGIFFGLCAIMDEGIEIAWGAHAVNNIFLSVFFTQESSAIQTPALFRISEYNPLSDFAGLIIISLIFLYMCRKKFGWSRWQSVFSKIEKPVEPEEDYIGGFGLYGNYEEDE